MEEIIENHISDSINDLKIKIFDEYYILVDRISIRNIELIFCITNEEVLQKIIKYVKTLPKNNMVVFNEEKLNLSFNKIMKYKDRFDINNFIVLLNKLKRDAIFIQDYETATKYRDMEISFMGWL